MRVQALLTAMESHANIPLRPGADPRQAPADTRATPARQVDDVVLTRRSFLAAGVVALGLPASASDAAPLAHGHRVRLRLTLPVPTGPHTIGTVQLHLIDHSRRDPWVPARPRELMISIWYPAVSTGSYPSAPWMPQPAGDLFLSQLVGSLPSSGGRVAPPGSKPPTIPLPGVQLPVTHARDGAPVLSPGTYPVVLYQPGQGDVRELGTGLVSDLASRGYVVVTMDDTYEAVEEEFPGGRVVTTRPNQSPVDSVRIADTRFVLDELASLASGGNPDAEHRPLPSGLGTALDLAQVGMFGHSLGGATAAKAMAADARISAGINLDGSMFLANPALRQNISKLGAQLAMQLGDRAFMIMTHQGHDTHSDPSLAGFWSHQQGWRRFLTLRNAHHYSYTDLEQFLGQLLTARIAPRQLTPARVSEVIGTIQPTRAVAAQRAYIRAFFDLQLRGLASANTLLSGPSPNYPEIQFLGR
jgi:predicted dienelactone hydrolase